MNIIMNEFYILYYFYNFQHYSDNVIYIIFILYIYIYMYVLLFKNLKILYIFIKYFLINLFLVKF